MRFAPISLAIASAISVVLAQQAAVSKDKKALLNFHFTNINRYPVIVMAMVVAYLAILRG